MYYRYLDTFKTRAETIDDLFDFLDYCSVESSIKNYFKAVSSMLGG